MQKKTRWWFDPRFAIGVGLVVVSVLGVVGVVAASDSTVPVYSARSALSPGDRIHSDDLVVERVSLGAAGTRYLRPQDLPRGGLVVVKVVGAGELLPVSAVGSAAGLRVTSLVVPVAGTIAHDVGPGSVVDVWSAEKTETGVYAPPAVLVSAATIVKVTGAEGIVATTTSQSVELLVPRSATARVLRAVTNGDAVSLVPAAVPAP